MKYKKGDKVYVRNDLSTGKYGSNSVVEPMLKHRGKKITIYYVNGTYYNIKEDNQNWSWTDEMFIGKEIKNWKGEFK